MPQVQNTTNIPESITLNGVTYPVKDTPELQQFIQDVAKVERTKLYSQMESLRNQIQQLNNVQVVPESNQPFDSKALIAELKNIFVTADTLKETIAASVKEVVQPVLDATKRNEQNELEAYREKLIRENEATCIPDLVSGTTREELDANLKKSIEIRAKYATPAPSYKGDPTLQSQANQQTPPAGPSSQAQGTAPQNPPTPSAPQTQAVPPQPQTPSVPMRPAPDPSNGAPNVKQMSMQEFARQREQLEANLRNIYGGSNL